MKTLKISAKCSDLFSIVLRENGNLVQEYEGYVPEWFPNPKEEHYGDYVQLTIDVETGKILNWKKPSAKDLKETFKVNKESAHEAE